MEYTRSQYRKLKSRALKNNIDFNLEIEDIIVPDNCPLLDVPLIEKDPYYGPSIDRVDPRGGYTKDNVRVISRLANVMKNNATQNQLRTFQGNIIDYLLYLK